MQLVKNTKFKQVPGGEDDILVVPRAVGVNLSNAQQQRILRYLAAGGQVVAEGRQAWLEKIGFGFPGGQMSISSVSDLGHEEMVQIGRAHV